MTSAWASWLGISSRRATTGALLALASITANAGVVSEEKVLVPLADEQRISLRTSTLVADEGFWVSISLIALSDSDTPQGKVSVEMFPDSLPVPVLIPRHLTLEASEENTLPRSDKLKAELETSLEQLPESELEERMGVALSRAMRTYAKGGGKALGRTYAFRYPAANRRDLVYRVTVKGHEGNVYPLVLQATMGQGEIPAKYLDVFASANAPPEEPTNPRAVLALGSLIFLAFAYLFRRWRG
ncbi:hypothetical protein [Hydrogenophaga sp. 5NK40-0174]|uniref:hypothetical protein n=1 Tax=Hydrogenophaga sp. 5NK40-0174 TaxID=3127649 RepID=UPI003105B493